MYEVLFCFKRFWQKERTIVGSDNRARGAPRYQKCDFKKQQK